MAAGFKADISGTERFLLIFYCVSEIYVKFGVFKKKSSVSKLKYYENY